MPKKSRRRAKTGGSGGGGGKVPGGGGGAGRGGADKNQPTAKNSDDENNIHPAGILTAGAVRMFSECAIYKVYSVPKHAAPVLQVVSDLEEGVGFDAYRGVSLTSHKCYLSDGTRCILARLYPQSDFYGHLLRSNQVARHSVIRVPSYQMTGVERPGGDQDVLLVARMELVERDADYVLGRTLPTSCPVESILTAGAVRMLLEKENMKTVTFARKSTPTLQVMKEPSCRGDGFGGYLLQLSDGRDSIKALITSSADVALPSADLIIKHSIIRMDTSMVAPGTAVQLPLEDRVLVLGGLEVVATNVGRLIGNPTKVKTSGSPTRSSPPSSGLVRESWSYDKKLQFASEYCIETARLFGDGSGDVGPALHHLSSYFQLPREQTEPFRAVMLLQWRIMLANWTSFMVKRNGGQFKAEMAATYDRFFANDRAIGLLKRLSSVEGGESVIVRAMASFIRGFAKLGISYMHASDGSLSNSLNCLRRFSVLVHVSECDLTTLASAYDAVTCKSGWPSGKTLVEYLISDCTKCLQFLGGPSQREVSSMFDLSPDYGVPFFHTVGGNFCDCCGKTTEEANLPVLFKCKTCRLAWYCSASCQAECWDNGHRNCCKKFGRFEKGDKVILQGLKKRPDLNGTLVSVEDLPLNGRATVSIIPPRNLSMNRSVQVGAVLSIKKENLRHHRPLK